MAGSKAGCCLEGAQRRCCCRGSLAEGCLCTGSAWSYLRSAGFPTPSCPRPAFPVPLPWAGASFKTTLIELAAVVAEKTALWLLTHFVPWKEGASEHTPTKNCVDRAGVVWVTHGYRAWSCWWKVRPDPPPRGNTSSPPPPPPSRRLLAMTASFRLFGAQGESVRGSRCGWDTWAHQVHLAPPGQLRQLPVDSSSCLRDLGAKAGGESAWHGPGTCHCAGWGGGAGGPTVKAAATMKLRSDCTPSGPSSLGVCMTERISDNGRRPRKFLRVPSLPRSPAPPPCWLHSLCSKPTSGTPEHPSGRGTSITWSGRWSQVLVN